MRYWKRFDSESYTVNNYWDQHSDGTQRDCDVTLKFTVEFSRHRQSIRTRRDCDVAQFTADAAAGSGQYRAGQCGKFAAFRKCGLWRRRYECVSDGSE